MNASGRHEADRHEREVQLAKLEADIFAGSMLPGPEHLVQKRWCILVQPPGKRVGKTTLLRKLAARYVAAGRKVYVVTTSSRAFYESGFGEVGAKSLVDTASTDELFAGDRSDRVYLVDDASHINMLLPLVNAAQEDVRCYPGSIYIETRVKDDRCHDNVIAFPRIIVPMPPGDYLPPPHSDNESMRAFFYQLSTQAT